MLNFLKKLPLVSLVAIFFFAVSHNAYGQHSNSPESFASGFAKRCSPKKLNSDSAWRALEQSEQLSADAWCSAMVVGISDGLSQAAVSSHYTFKTAYCIRDGYTAAQLKDVVLKYIVDRPEIGDLYLAEAVLAALRDHFPCNGQPIPPSR